MQTMKCPHSTTEEIEFQSRPGLPFSFSFLRCTYGCGKIFCQVMHEYKPTIKIPAQYKYLVLSGNLVFEIEYEGNFFHTKPLEGGETP